MLFVSQELNARHALLMQAGMTGARVGEIERLDREKRVQHKKPSLRHVCAQHCVLSAEGKIRHLLPRQADPVFLGTIPGGEKM